MLESLTITESAPQQAAVVHVTVPRSDIQQAMGEAVGELMGAFEQQGVQPDGPMFCYHFRITPDMFDFEVGFPVDKPVQTTGRVKPGALPAVQVARTVYVGGYEGLGEAWGELTGWLKQQGHEPAEHLWERYLSGPESSTDPSTWRTELNRPIVAQDA